MVSLKRGLPPLVMAVLVALLALPVFALGTGEKPKERFLYVRGGETAVTLDAQAVEKLGRLGVTPTPKGAARVKDGAVEFPVTTGELDQESLLGQVRHKGELELAANGTVLNLGAFDVNVDQRPNLTAIVNGAPYDRLQVFDLDLADLDVNIEGRSATLSGVKVTLSAAGLAGLKAVFGDAVGTEFAAGDLIGTAVVRTHLAGVARQQASVFPYKGATTVALDPDTAQILAGLGVEVGTLGAAKPGVTGISFPILPLGRVNTQTLSGKILHYGKLTLSKGDTTVILRRFDIETANGVLTGRVGTKSRTRAPLFKLDLANENVQTVVTPRALRVAGVGLSLTPEAAALLNEAFGVDAFAEGLPIGTATTDISVLRRPPFPHWPRR